MKKAFALVLVLCLLCGSALAATDGCITEQKVNSSTEVIYDVGDVDEFTLVIPPTIELTETTPGKAESELAIELNAKRININGFKIIISLAGSLNGYKLVNGSNTIGYDIMNGQSSLKAAHEIFKWEYHGTLNTDEAPKLTLSADIPDNMKPGVYSDVLTFKVDVYNPNDTPGTNPDGGNP